MHLVFGLLITALAFALAHEAKTALPHFGLVNPAAMFLLALGPVGVTLVSHPLSEAALALRVLLRAFRHDKQRSLKLAENETYQLARAVREARWPEAEAELKSARAEMVRLFGPLLLRRYDAEQLREAIASGSYHWMAEVRGADEFFQSLGRLCPAFGMIGTIMGLVDLFAHLRDSASLGPGMAMALLATLYGLALCYCFYLPLAVRVRNYLAAGIGEQRMIEQALWAAYAGRPIHEVRTAFGVGQPREDAA